MAKNVSGTCTGASISVFAKGALSNMTGYQIQNNGSHVMYIEDSGVAATTASYQLAAGQTYTSPDGCVPVLGVNILGTNLGPCGPNL